MSSSSRKMIGTVLLIILILVYAFAIMLIGTLVIDDLSGLAELLFYLAAGCLWALPAMVLLKWMLKSDTDNARER